jgi:hypothetical protein
VNGIGLQVPIPKALVSATRGECITFFALAQGRFHLLEFCYIEQGAEQAERVSLFVALNSTASLHVALGAVGPQHAMVKSNWCPSSIQRVTVWRTVATSSG